MMDEGAAIRFVRAHGLECGPQARYIDLASEVGELGKALLKASAYGTEAMRPTENLMEEAGDCLFSLLALCGELDIEPEAALIKALEKYEGRIAARGSASSEGR